MATRVGPFVDPSTARPARRKPANMLPESPRKARAGGKLNGRKPRSAPASAAATKPAAGWPRATDMKNTAVALKNADPVATPSAPSSRLNALVIPTSHRTVNASPKTGPSSRRPRGKDNSSIRTPIPITARAMRICPPNFAAAGTG